MEGKTVVNAVDVMVAVVTVLMIVGAFVTVNVRPDVIVATVLLVTEVIVLIHNSHRQHNDSAGSGLHFKAHRPKNNIESAASDRK